jgi:hypothetical protein
MESLRDSKERGPLTEKGSPRKTDTESPV